MVLPMAFLNWRAACCKSCVQLSCTHSHHLQSQLDPAKRSEGWCFAAGFCVVRNATPARKTSIAARRTGRRGPVKWGNQEGVVKKADGCLRAQDEQQSAR